MVGLDPVTNPYHAAILGLPRPSETFTNLYHRDGGQGIELSIVASIGHQVAGWHRVITVDNGAEPYTHSRRVRTVVGRCRGGIFFSDRGSG